MNRAILVSDVTEACQECGKEPAVGYYCILHFPLVIDGKVQIGVV